MSRFEPWRSLEHKRRDREVEVFYRDEFAPGASEAPETVDDGVTRRSVLSLIAAGASAAGLAGCRRPVEHIVPFVEVPSSVIPGLAKRYATTMPFGLEALGVVVESSDGRPTKVEGNPNHPRSLGGTGVFGQAAILQLYDPDRSQHVLSNGEHSSWEAFESRWAELATELEGSGGAGLGLIVESSPSPTAARLLDDVRARFPQARIAVWEPVSEENLIAGARLATGQDMRPVHSLGLADVVLAIDSDFLVGETDAVRAARDFAERRRQRDGDEGTNRLYAVEACHSSTGANADHRFRVASSRIPAFVAQLVTELMAQGLGGVATGSGGAETIGADQLRVLASDLLAHRGRSLIVAGRRQPAAVHAVVMALNSALGNVGQTVEYRPIGPVIAPRAESLRELVTAMTAGEISTLVVSGANPAYTAPADLGFVEAIGQVANVIHHGYHVDETAALAGWHLPSTHFLESWGDAVAIDGTQSVVQPLIEPLFGGWSTLDLFARLAGSRVVEQTASAEAPGSGEGVEDAAASDAESIAAEAEAAATPAPAGRVPTGHELVRESLQSVLVGDFERAWKRALHDGLVAAEESAGLAGEDAAQAPAADGAILSDLSALAGGPGPSASSMEAVFVASPSVFDGRFANNAWLQELPDAMTKVAWDNVALLSPATAERLEIEKEDLIRLTLDGREIEAPAWVQPGLADDTVVLELGYGRRAGGVMATGTGYDAYALRFSTALDTAGGLGVAKAGGKYEIACTQDHHGMEGRPLVRQTTLERYREHPDFAQEMEEVPYDKSLWQDWVYDQSPQWGMTIDLDACVGCNACVVACQSENSVPSVGKDQVRRGREMHWIRLDRYFLGDEHEPDAVFQPIPCMHCETAPCEQVCPVAATVHDAEGLNVMVYNRCIGTRYCANNCPYKVRRFNFYNYTKHTPEIVRLGHNPDVTVRSRGVMEKCTYCTQRISAAKIEAKREERSLADGDVVTACQQACPANAIEFGDVLDPESRVARAKASPRNYGLLAGLMTRPRTTYLARIGNPHPELAPPEPVDDHSGESHGGESHGDESPGDETGADDAH